MQEQLLGHLLGALDESEQESVDARLERDPKLRRELAQIRRRLEPLEALRQDFDPPAGLAERTCRLVAAEDRRQSHVPQGSRRPPMSPEAAPPSWIGGLRWHDVAVAATVFVAATLLTIPAIQSSRFQARLLSCQDRLREIGRALGQFSEKHGGYFPSLSRPDGAVVPGSYASLLLRDGMLTDVSQFYCPGSPPGADKAFSVPLIDEIQSTSPEKWDPLANGLAGIYAYTVGYRQDGVYHRTKNLHRRHFGVLSDAPSTNLPGYQSDNHGGRGQNVLFEDGHVWFLISPRPNDQGDDIFRNDEGQIAPGNHRDDSVIVRPGRLLIWRNYSGPRPADGRRLSR